MLPSWFVWCGRCPTSRATSSRAKSGPRRTSMWSCGGYGPSTRSPRSSPRCTLHLCNSLSWPLPLTTAQLLRNQLIIQRTKHCFHDMSRHMLCHFSASSAVGALSHRGRHLPHQEQFVGHACNPAAITTTSSLPVRPAWSDSLLNGQCKMRSVDSFQEGTTDCRRTLHPAGPLSARPSCGSWQESLVPPWRPLQPKAAQVLPSHRLTNAAIAGPTSEFS